MKVLFACRPQIFSVPGGDTVQLLKMQKYLAACTGVEAVISADPAEIKHSTCDIVHVFNLFDIESMYAQITQTREIGIPAVITTNYWNPLEFFFETSHSLFHQLARAVLPRKTMFDYYCRQKRQRMQHDLQLQREALLSAAMILPNSNGEAAELQRDFDLPVNKFSVVYNAVDFDDIDAADPNLFAERYGVRDFVLCVGRFEER